MPFSFVRSAAAAAPNGRVFLLSTDMAEGHQHFPFLTREIFADETVSERTHFQFGLGDPKPKAQQHRYIVVLSSSLSIIDLVVVIFLPRVAQRQF